MFVAYRSVVGVNGVEGYYEELILVFGEDRRYLANLRFKQPLHCLAGVFDAVDLSAAWGDSCSYAVVARLNSVCFECFGGVVGSDKFLELIVKTVGGFGAWIYLVFDSCNVVDGLRSLLFEHFAQESGVIVAVECEVACRSVGKLSLNTVGDVEDYLPLVFLTAYALYVLKVGKGLAFIEEVEHRVLERLSTLHCHYVYLYRVDSCGLVEELSDGVGSAAVFELRFRNFADGCICHEVLNFGVADVAEANRCFVDDEFAIVAHQVNTVFFLERVDGFANHSSCLVEVVLRRHYVNGDVVNLAHFFVEAEECLVLFILSLNFCFGWLIFFVGERFISLLYEVDGACNCIFFVKLLAVELVGLNCTSD